MKNFFYALFLSILAHFPYYLFSQSQIHAEPNAIHFPVGGHEQDFSRSCVPDTNFEYLSRATGFYNLGWPPDGFFLGTHADYYSFGVHYTGNGAQTEITEVMAYFTDIRIMGTPDSLTATVHIATADSMPGAIVGVGKVFVPDIDTLGYPTYIPLSNVIPFSGDYVIVLSPGAIDDTVAVFSTNLTSTMGGPDGQMEKRVRMYHTGQNLWVRAWDSILPGGNNYNADALLIPIMCSDTVSGGPTCQSGFYSYPDTTQPFTTYVVNTATSSSGALNYLWDFGDGNTDTSATPTHTYATGGMYLICLTVSDTSGCSDVYCDSVQATLKTNAPWTIHVIFEGATGVRPPSLQTIRLFPNPVNGEDVFLQSLHPFSGTFSLFNSVGAQLFDEQISASEGVTRLKIDPSMLSPGIYFFRILPNEGEKGMLSGKLIVE